MTADTILVTGGAGFVGSHFARLAHEQGRRVIVLDDLSGGVSQLPPSMTLVVGDIGDRDLVLKICRDEQVGAVVHFAGKIQVGESVKAPEKYFDVNVARTLRFLAAIRDAGVGAMLFSSTAAVYGDPEDVPIPEDARLAPVNPYGASKLAIEHALSAWGTAYGLRWGALRYFNAAGAHPDGTMLEAHEPETHLIPLALDAALGRRAPLTVFGEDYPTEDGTCIRDYIHVLDLGSAHLAALDALAGGPVGAMNLGTGHGYSVRQVLEAAAEVLGKPVPHTIGPRREGDPPQLVADPKRAMTRLHWKPARSDLRTVVEDALRPRVDTERSAQVQVPATEQCKQAADWVCPSDHTPGWDVVDQASWESFPASDPPGYVPSHAASEPVVPPGADEDRDHPTEYKESS